jgi:phage-related protein
MVAVGDVAGAQQLILKEMEVQFGGSALKATETLEGGMVLLSEGIDDAKGAIGDALLPILTRFTNFGLTMLVPMLKDVLGAFGAWITSIDWDTIIGAVGKLIQGFTGMASGIDWGTVFLSLNTLASVIGQVLIEAFTVIQPLLIVVKDVFMQLFSVITSPAVIEILTAIGGAFMSIASIAGTVISALTPLASLIASTFLGAVQALLNGLAPAFTTIQNHIAVMTPYIQSAIKAIGDVFASPALKSAMDGIVGIFGVLGEIVSAVVGILSGLVMFVVSNLTPVIEELWPVVEIAFNTIFSVIDNVVGLVRGILDSLLLLLKGDFTGAWDTLKNAISTAWTGIQTSVQTGIDAVKAKLKEWIDGAAQFGKDLVAGIASGISSSASKIADAAKNAAQSALDSAKALLGISSPSKVMAKQVGLPIGQGLAAGIMESIPAIRGAMSVSLGAAQGQATQSIQNYYLTASYQTAQSESSIRNDLRAMQLLSGAV